MKNTTSPARQAALITALILGGSGWVRAQTNQWPTNQGQFNQSQTPQPVTALGRPPDGITADRSTNSRSLQTIKANKGSSLIGTTVKNQQGEQLGRIRDLVIDFNSERVAYVVLESDVGPHPGMESEPTEVMAKPAHGEGAIVPLWLYPPGFDLSSLVIYDPAVSYWAKWGSKEIVSSGKLHAIPLRALQSDPAGTSLILNADKDRFEASAGFDQDNWPGVTTAVWGAEPFQKPPDRTLDAQEQHDLEQQKIKAQQGREQ